MKNVRFLVVGASSLLVVGVFMGREMASWRPVVVANVAPYAYLANPLRASKHLVTFTTYSNRPQIVTSCNRYDVQSGQMRVSRFVGEHAAGTSNNFLWHLKFKPFFYLAKPSPSQLEVEDESRPGTKRVFNFMVDGFTDYSPCVQILPEQNRVVLLSQRHIYEWNFTTGKLFHHQETPLTLDRKLSRDGQSYILADHTRFQFGDVTTGTVGRTVYLKNIKAQQESILSPHGRYALLEGPKGSASISVVSTSTGKVVYNCSTNVGIRGCIMPDDEKTIFVREGRQWNVLDFGTGAVLRHLPRLTNTSIFAVSPDGATLYSVANGKLYQQRAR